MKIDYKKNLIVSIAYQFVISIFSIIFFNIINLGTILITSIAYGWILFSFLCFYDYLWSKYAKRV